MFLFERERERERGGGADRQRQMDRQTEIDRNRERKVIWIVVTLFGIVLLTCHILFQLEHLSDGKLKDVNQASVSYTHLTLPTRRTV